MALNCNHLRPARHQEAPRIVDETTMAAVVVRIAIDQRLRAEMLRNRSLGVDAVPVGEHLDGPKRPAAAAISLIAHRPDDRCTLGPLLARVKALRQWRRSLAAQHGAFCAQYGVKALRQWRRSLVAQHGAFCAQYGAFGALEAVGVR
jgi:hypothetical protein